MSEARDIVPARRETLVAPSLDDRVGRFTLRQLSVVQWIGVVVAPLAWTAQQVVGYGVGGARCSGGGVRGGGGYDTRHGATPASRSDAVYSGSLRRAET